MEEDEEDSEENKEIQEELIFKKDTSKKYKNLPSFYIISFVEVLQNYIYYFLKNEQGQNDINGCPNEYEKIITSLNEKIEKMQEKILKMNMKEQ